MFALAPSAVFVPLSRRIDSTSLHRRIPFSEQIESQGRPRLREAEVGLASGETVTEVYTSVSFTQMPDVAIEVNFKLSDIRGINRCASKRQASLVVNVRSWLQAAVRATSLVRPLYP